MLRALLWVTCIAMLPVPYAVTDVGWVPVLRLLAMGGLTGWIWLTEGGLVAGLIAGVLGLQIAAHGLWLYWATGTLLRRLPELWRAPTVGLFALLLFGVAQWPIYHTPLSNHAARANLWSIFH